MNSQIETKLINEVYIRRKQKVIIHSDDVTANVVLTRRYISTMIHNINSLGYTLSEELIHDLQTIPTGELETFYFEIVGILRKLVGADKDYRPMYPNFPQQVMDASECELFFNAIIHYWSGGTLLPDYEKEERFPLLDQTKLKVIDRGIFISFKLMLRDLLSSTTSISASDKEDIETYVASCANEDKFRYLLDILPVEIPMKENVAFVANIVLANTTEYKAIHLLVNYFKTATDVLRLAVALSDGDVSLATKTKFRSFKNKERRFLMTMLNNCSNIEEDMIRYREDWIRVGERIHPSTFDAKYDKAIKAFNKLRNDVKIRTFNSKVRQSTDENNIQKAVDLLKQRPGEFARKLDHLLRIADSDLTLTEFALVAHEVAVPVLLQVMKHFKHRAFETSMIRSFFPKGSVAKVWTTENKLPELDAEVCNRVVKICINSLIEIFKERESLGKVFIDPALKDHLIPFSQRSASKALKTYVRGSKISLDPELNTLRAFIWWKNLPGQTDENDYGDSDHRVDIDLSMAMFDEDWGYIDRISYSQLRSNGMGWHSGDITDAPKGASEFIDLDFNRVRETNGRFIAMQVYCFTDVSFIDIPECYMGWMERQYPDSGEVYEASTVVNKADITANTRISIPIVIDVKDMKVIWTDLALTSDSLYNNVEGNKFNVASMARAIHELIKPSLYELFELHCAARGSLCETIDEADTVFSLEKGITPFDVDVIISHYL
jgi:hypothetical protein